MTSLTATHDPSLAGPERTSLWLKIRRGAWGYVFVSPWILLYLIFGLYPLALSFFLTFFDYSFVTPENRAFVGIGNWVQGITDPLYWKGLYNIVLNQAVFIVLKNGIGLLVAALLFRITWGARLFRTIYFLPVITSTVVLMTIGDNLAGPGGPIQGWMMDIGLIDAPVFWKTYDTLPMIVIALINTWKWFGISMVILLAGMYGIDPRLYEAAAVDGATGWDMFRRITLPLLRPMMVFVLVTSVTGSFQIFDTVAVATNGGPLDSTRVIVHYIVQNAFGFFRMGYASAMSVVLGLVMLAYTILQMRIMRANENDLA